jgi:hypothetical protein
MPVPVVKLEDVPSTMNAHLSVKTTIAFGERRVGRVISGLIEVE